MNTIEHIVPPDELMAYLDGELAPDRAAIVRRHMADCAACQALTADLQQASDAMRSWEVEAPPDSLRAPAAPMAAPRRRWTAFTAWPVGLRYAAILACCIAAAPAVMWMTGFQPRFAVSAPAPAAVNIEVTGDGRAGGSGGARRGAAAAAPLIASAGRRGSAVASAESQPPVPAAPSGSKIARTVSLAIVTPDVSAVRPAVEILLRDVGGFVGSMQATGDGEPATMRATLRVPAERLDAAVTTLRKLGRVVEETHTGEDVGEQVRDLGARLANSRSTEARLAEVLRTRTGRVSDVLEVEREIARVREEIERMDAERTHLEWRVAYATISLHVSEERQATLDIGPLPLSTRIRNAAVDGLRRAFESVVAVTLALLHAAPVMLLWVVVLWWPIRFVIRRSRQSVEKPA